MLASEQWRPNTDANSNTHADTNANSNTNTDAITDANAITCVAIQRHNLHYE